MILKPFSVPAKQVFVVTGFSWEVFGAGASLAQTIGLRLEAQGGFNSISAKSTAMADSAGHAGASEVFGTPIVVKSGFSLCLTSLTPASNLQGTAQGFFAPDW